MPAGESRSGCVAVCIESTITTAGFNRATICWEQREYGRNGLEGHFDDDRFFAYIACAEEDDDFMDPDIGRKGNPNLGVSIKTDFIAASARRAKNSPADENTFRMLHLNQWMQQSVRWLPMHLWDECGGGVSEEFPLERFRGRTCYGGLDLASTRDVNALVLVFPNDDDN